MKSISLTALVVSLLSQQVIAGWYGNNYYGFGNGFGGGFGSGFGGGYGIGNGLSGLGGNGGFWGSSFGSPYIVPGVVLYPIVLPSGSGSLWGPNGGWYGNIPVGYWRPWSSPYSVWFSGPSGVSQPGAASWGPRMVGSPATWFTSGNLGGQGPSGGLYRLPVLGGIGGLSGVGPSVYDTTYDDSISVGSSSPLSWSSQNSGSEFVGSSSSLGSFGSLGGSSTPQSGFGNSVSLLGDDSDRSYDLSSGSGSFGTMGSLGMYGQLGGLSGYGSMGYFGSPYLRWLCRATGLSPRGVQRLYRKYRRSGMRSSFLTYLRRKGYLGGYYGGFPFGVTQGSGSQPGIGGSYFSWSPQPSYYYSWGTPGGSYGGSSNGGLTSGSYGWSSYPSGGSFSYPSGGWSSYPSGGLSSYPSRGSSRSSSSWSSGSSSSSWPQDGLTQVKLL
ncbi:hypothetical protein MTO96_031837 [Rhipicephalus appendiculatus]